MVTGSRAGGYAYEDNGAPPKELAVSEMLRLLGAGASGAILTALGDGPLRTKALTERVRGYTPRTVYRYTGKLTQLGLIAREEEPGVPSKVIHSLSEPRGRELFELVDAYADASLVRLRSGEIDAHAWGSLALLADLWESGMVEALNFGQRSPTELARVEHGLSYHQVNRRAGLFAMGGLLHEESTIARRRSYELSETARRGMALIAGLGRWRRRHVVPKGTTGLTPREVGIVLRAALPLVSMPEHAGKSFGIEIDRENMGSGEADSVWACVEPDGSVLSCENPLPEVDDHLRGKVASLVDALIDGPRKMPSQNGNGLIKASLERLHLRLWEPNGTSSSALAEAVASGNDDPELSYS